MTYALIFPGQGSQAVGMGHDWSAAHVAARRTFEEADDVLGFALSRLCFEGPDEDLQLTANTQPAILTVSVAILRSLLAVRPEIKPVAVAGHSLGEYSAHVAAGSLGFADALRLVRRRGELMQEAVPVGVGAMAAVIGMGDAELQAIVDQVDSASSEVVSVANFNSPGQTVIAGHRAAVERALELAKAAGARMAKMLPVSAPFHSPLMAPARAGLEPQLAATHFSDPRLPVVVNIDAVAVNSGDAAREALGRQIDGPVRWIESIELMRQAGGELRADAFVEIGPGKVLTGLGKRIDKDASWLASPSPDAVEDFLQQLLT